METLKNIIEYIAIITSITLLVKISFQTITYYQQSHYHLSSYKKIIKHFYVGNIINTLILLIVVFIWFLNYWFIQAVYILYLIMILFFKYRQNSIITLKVTFRIYRIGSLILMINTIIATLILFWFELKELIASIGILIVLSPFILLVCSLIMTPIEMLISKSFQLRAKKKLKNFKTTIIGITGSYGKTSTKNILFSLLKRKYITFATEKSYNTLNGVSKNINELLTSSHQMMIVEMGATKTNDIQKLVKLTHPLYGIVTEVGPQHLESFKSIENILDEKMKLIDSLPENGIGIINYHNPYIRNYSIKSNCKIIKIGFDQDCDYYAYDIKGSSQGLEFKVNFKGENLSLKTRLLGSHHVINILCSLALAVELGIDYKTIKYEVNNLDPVENRLSISVNNSITLINDAFNSNHQGFKNALEVLNYFQSPKILVTPGIVEAGEAERKINYDLAEVIAKTCDFVILVRNKCSEFIKEGLNDLQYNQYLVVEKFTDAIAHIYKNYQNATVLIENDISDIYKI